MVWKWIQTKLTAFFLQHKISINGLKTFQITIDDTVLHMEDKVKNLGVIFDSLSFEHHIKSLCSRLNGTLSYLNRSKNLLDQKSRILLINALIFSHLNYCSSICSMKYKNVSTLLQKLQAMGNISNETTSPHC